MFLEKIIMSPFSFACFFFRAHSLEGNHRNDQDCLANIRKRVKRKMVSYEVAFICYRPRGHQTSAYRPRLQQGAAVLW